MGPWESVPAAGSGQLERRMERADRRPPLAPEPSDLTNFLQASPSWKTPTGGNRSPFARDLGVVLHRAQGG
jgi:hypothetical protein